MSGGIETFALILLAHTQPNRQIDDLVSDGGHHAGPDEGGDYALELDPQLGAHPRIADLAGDPVLDQPGPEKRRVVEYAREQRAENSADGVNAEHVERIIRTQQLLQAAHAPEAEKAGREPDDERTGDADIARRWRNGHQAGHRPGRRTEHRGLALEDRFADRKSTRLNSSHSQISYAVFCLA